MTIETILTVLGRLLARLAGIGDILALFDAFRFIDVGDAFGVPGADLCTVSRAFDFVFGLVDGLPCIGAAGHGEHEKGAAERDWPG